MKIRVRLSYRVLALVLSTVFLVIFFAANIINKQFKASIIENVSKRDASMLGNIAVFHGILVCILGYKLEH